MSNLLEWDGKGDIASATITDKQGSGYGRVHIRRSSASGFCTVGIWYVLGGAPDVDQAKELTQAWFDRNHHLLQAPELLTKPSEPR